MLKPLVANGFWKFVKLLFLPYMENPKNPHGFPIFHVSFQQNEKPPVWPAADKKLFGFCTRALFQL